MQTAKVLKSIAATAVVVVLATGAAQAAVVVQPTCNIVNVTTSTMCQTVLDNNDSVADMNGFNAGAGVFGVKNWIFGGKSAGDNVAVAPYNLSGSPVDVKSGVWSVASFNNWTKAALVVKAGSEAWVAYLLDVTKLNGTWTTADIRNNGGQQPTISHMTLYLGGAQVVQPPAPVPLPAAGLLLAGALGGIAALRRRKTRA